MSEEEPNLEKESRLVRWWDSGTAGVLIHDKWFRAAFLILLLLVIMAGLFLPRIWTTTPAGFTPVVRVSGLDRVQARSLKSSAQNHEAASRYKEAVHAWTAAIANDPGKPELIHGLVRTVLNEKPLNEENIGPTFGRLMWLLRLTKTNQADLELTLEFLDRCRLDDFVVRFGKPQEDSLNGAGAERYARALYTTGDYPGFARFWDRHEKEFAANPELMVYRHAWMSLHGPEVKLQEGRRLLAEDRRQAATRLLAARLQLDVSAALLDNQTFEESLRMLEDAHQDRPRDHALHWRLLRDTGRGVEALARARAYGTAPSTPAEARDLALAYDRLGMGETVIDYLGKWIATLGYDPDLWLLHARLMIKYRRWAELRSLSVRMRNSLDVGNLMQGYSFFLEGLAEQRSGREDAARLLMDKAVNYEFPEETGAYQAARQMVQAGFPTPALELLRKLEPRFAKDAGYWFERTVAAFGARNSTLIIQSARKAYELDPNRVSHMVNYAGALLVTRTEPEEAMKVTLQALSVDPGHVGAQLNHILALVQLRRLDDAEQKLASLNTLTFNANEQATYHLARFDLFRQKGDLVRAREAANQIDRQALVPLEVDWLEKTLESLPAS